MLFEIQRDIFFDGLSKTVPIAEKRSPLPILSHVLLDAGEAQVTLTATDLEVGLQTIHEGDVKETGRVTLPSRKVLEIVRELPGGLVTVQSIGEGRIKIIAGESMFELAGMDPADYPAWSSFEQIKPVAVEAEKLIDMIEKTSFASSSDESRFNLNGILFEWREDKNRLVATDGHRLALMDGELGLGLEPSVLVPKKSLNELRRILENVQGEILLGFEEKNLVVRTDRFTMTLRLIDGEYPDYTKVIPKSGDKILTTDRMRLLQALKRVAILTSDRNRGINMSVAPGRMELTASHQDLGAARDVVEVDYKDEEFSLIINVAYLIEALGVVDTETISIEYIKEGAPVIIRPHPVKDYFNLVMPMRN